MPEKIEVHVLRSGELRSGRLPSNWNDPEGHASPPPHHRRMMLDNPLAPGDDTPCRALLLVDDYVAGHVSLLPAEVTVAGEAVPVLWGFNLLVSARFRGRGIATKLIKCWQDLSHTAIGTHVNLPSVGIYRKLGWTEFHTPTYFVVRRSRRFLQGYVGLRPLAALASPVVDAGLAFRRSFGRLLGIPVKPGLWAEAVDSLSPEFDPLLARQSAPVVTHRSAAYVNYFLHAGKVDDARELRLCLVRDESGATAGYFILQRKRQPVLSERFKDVCLGSMRDWRVLDESRADTLSLALLAMEEFFDWGGDAFMVTIPDAESGRSLRRLGFGSAEPLRTLFHAVPPSPLAAEEFKDQRAWGFTPAEADGLFI